MKTVFAFQNIQLIFTKIKMRKYCVQTNDNNGWSFANKPHNCLSSNQSVPCTSQYLVILSALEGGSSPLLSVLISMILISQININFSFFWIFKDF